MSTLIPVVSERDHILGSGKSTVELVEYGDYQCRHCGQGHLVVQSLFGILGTQLRFVFRHFPLTHLHPQALEAALLAEGAGLQGRFWQMHDLLYDNQEALEERDLSRYASRLGLDLDRLRADMPAALARVQEDATSGARSGVNGTPTFFVNGVRYEGPWWDVSHFSRVLADVAQQVPVPV